MSSKDLFKFTEGSRVDVFTSSNEAEVYLGVTYAPKIMGRGEISDKAQITKGSLDVTLPIDDLYAQHLLNSGVDAIVRLDIYSKNEAGVFRTEWKGRLASTAPKNNELVATFESVFSANRRVGSRKVISRTCPYALYGAGCNLNIADWLVAATVTGISTDGATIIVPEAAGFANNVLLAGVLICPDGTARYISGQSGTTLHLIRSSDALTAAFAAYELDPTFGAPVIAIAPGCTQLQNRCAEFDNLDNFGGYKYIPLTNPMAGSSIA